MTQNEINLKKVNRILKVTITISFLVSVVALYSESNAQKCTLWIPAAAVGAYCRKRIIVEPWFTINDLLSKGNLNFLILLLFLGSMLTFLIINAVELFHKKRRNN